MIAKNGPADAAPLARWLHVEPGEARGLAAAFFCALAMFASYGVLRPIRDTMGITSGVSTLPALFWGTFFVMLAVQPAYGALLARFERKRLLPWLYAFFALNLLGFLAWFHASADHTFIARVYFVWVSVYNLFVVSVFWSLMADVFRREQAARLFGMIAAGLSAGGLLGPLLAGTLSTRIGTIQLLPVSAALLIAAALLMRVVVRWSEGRGSDAAGADEPVARAAQPEGSAFGAFAQVARSPYLLGIAGFVLLLTSANTVLYLEQQRLVAQAIATPDERTHFFATLDFWVQAGALVTQFLLFARVQRALGFRATLALVPALMLPAFAGLALAPGLAAVVAASLVRRIGEFGFVRPCRDMLFTVVTPAEKYQAKNLLDPFVYPGRDAPPA